jgi:hypothetical protein
MDVFDLSQEFEDNHSEMNIEEVKKMMNDALKIDDDDDFLEDFIENNANTIEENKRTSVIEHRHNEVHDNIIPIKNKNAYELDIVHDTIIVNENQKVQRMSGESNMESISPMMNTHLKNAVSFHEQKLIKRCFKAWKSLLYLKRDDEAKVRQSLSLLTYE